MRKNFTRLFGLVVSVTIVAAFLMYASGARAGNGQNNSPNIKSGLWKDGKAIEWDLPELGIFDWNPRGYAPEQPVKFSHWIHVGKNKMECQYCHYGVTKSSASTIPPSELCMGCHKLVKTESPEIKKLTEYHNKGLPVPWIKVHKLQDHARFNHERHIKSGVGCQNCHGLVQEMDQVEKVSSMKMGFCVSCHRDQGASIDCATCHY
ncbi:cytochrome c3 family protein [bacterium]|nr:cytochrome c3 family protein [bacterium]